MNLSKHSKKAARFILHKAGALHGIRNWHRNRFRILMYHAFPESAAGLAESLARQCEHIRRHYYAVSMTEIGDSLRNGTRLPKNALAVTVDDGYYDFLANASPIFHAHRIPVLVYLISGFLDGKFWPWSDKIAYALDKTKLSMFQLSLASGKPPTTFAIATEEERRHAADTIIAAMKQQDGENPVPLHEHLARVLKVDLPADPPAHLAPMRWSDVRRLSKDGVDFGAHTVTHPMLSHIRNPQVLSWEIGESKKRIEEEIGRPVQHFSYPFGRPTDFNAASVEAVSRCGFLTATTAHFGLNDHRSHPLQLQRLAVDPMTPFDYFKEVLAGVHFT